MKVDPKLGGQKKEKEKVLCLVANGRRRRRRFFAWWPMEGEKKVSFSHIPTSPPQQLYLDLRFFPFDIKVLLYHGSRLLFTHSLPFPWPINHDHVF